MINKTLPIYEYVYTDNFDTQFRPLPEVVPYDTYFVDPHYGLDAYWNEELYDQDKLEYIETYNKPIDQIETDDLITDAHVSDALRYALIDLWTVNPHLPDTSAIPDFQAPSFFAPSRFCKKRLLKRGKHFFSRKNTFSSSYFYFFQSLKNSVFLPRKPQNQGGKIIFQEIIQT